MIEASQLKVGMRVMYVGGGSDTWSFRDKGTVSSWNDKYVFVKYDEQVHRLSMEGATAKATTRSSLVEIELEYNRALNCSKNEHHT
jgi:hypothetical protein